MALPLCSCIISFRQSKNFELDFAYIKLIPFSILRSLCVTVMGKVRYYKALLYIYNPEHRPVPGEITSVFIHCTRSKRDLQLNHVQAIYLLLWRHIIAVYVETIANGEEMG